MTFVRQARSRATEHAIARLTAGLVPLPLDRVALAPRVCGHCAGRGTARGGAVCALCGGAGTTRRFVPGDPTHVVLAQGPCGLGYQRLVAVALADGRVAFVHLRDGGRAGSCAYVRPAEQLPVACGAVGRQGPGAHAGNPQPGRRRGRRGLRLAAGAALPPQGAVR